MQAATDQAPSGATGRPHESGAPLPPARTLTPQRVASLRAVSIVAPHCEWATLTRGVQIQLAPLLSRITCMQTLLGHAEMEVSPLLVFYSNALERKLGLQGRRSVGRWSVGKWRSSTGQRVAKVTGGCLSPAGLINNVCVSAGLQCRRCVAQWIRMASLWFTSIG